MRDLYLRHVNITVTDGGLFTPDEGTEWRLGTHAAGISKLYYVTKGACSITMGAHTYEGRPGALFFIPAGTRHSYRILERPFSKYWMHLSFTPELELSPGEPIFSPVYPEKRALDAVFSRFCRRFGGERISDFLDVRAAAFEVLSLYFRALVPERVADALPGGRLGEVLKCIENNLQVPPSNARLAELCHMHEAHFTRYFKAEIGATPQSYILKLRMERAGELLRTSHLYISEIAERLVYYDGLYFSKVFKKYYSLTPTEYRRLYGRTMTER